MPYPASLIAYAFVKKGIECGCPVTQMKLQKLVYFAHGLHLAADDGPLINEVFQAWKFGPVVPSIYHDYKFYGSSPITDPDLYFVFGDAPSADKQLDTLNSSATKSIDATWDGLKDASAVQLSNWTHKDGGPWKRYYQPGISDVTIPNEDIKDYFKGFFVKK
jgi:uncharacterized phage-associated protein